MMTLTPMEIPQTKSGLDLLSALVKIIADPDTAQEQIDRISAHLDEAYDQDKALAAAKAEHEADKINAEKIIADRAAKLAEREKALSDLKNREASVAAREKLMADAQSAVDKRHSQLDEREDDLLRKLAEHERKVQLLENRIAQHELDAEALAKSKAEWDRKLAVLRG